jgi:crossover junction endodeoxyribonuclease RusA
MPFFRAGFNARHRRTGILACTRYITGKRFEPAELIVFTHGGDFAWYGKRRGGGEFLVWGEQAVIGTWDEFDMEPLRGHPCCDIERKASQAKPVKLYLPYPVSANRYWRTFVPKGQRRPITLVSEEAEDYKELCAARAIDAGVRVPFETPVELQILLVPENRVCMDLDNALKVTIDALKGLVYEDDSLIYKITARRGEPEPGKRLEVEVLPYEVPLAMERAA